MKNVITIAAALTALTFASEKAVTEQFMEHNSTYFENSYGYAVLPKIGKGACVVGFARGEGVLYKQGEIDGAVKTSFAVAGLALGGESYSQIVFFKTKEVYDSFKEHGFTFSRKMKPLDPTHEKLVFTNDIAVMQDNSKGFGLFYTPSLHGQKIEMKKQHS